MIYSNLQALISPFPIPRNPGSKKANSHPCTHSILQLGKSVFTYNLNPGPESFKSQPNFLISEFCQKFPGAKSIVSGLGNSLQKSQCKFPSPKKNSPPKMAISQPGISEFFPVIMTPFNNHSGDFRTIQLIVTSDQRN